MGSQKFRISSVIQIAFLVLGVVGIIPEAEASHHRGVDAWASIDAGTGGHVTLHARTRWRKDALTDPFFSDGVGVAPGRFGGSHFTCGYDHTQSLDTSVPSGMQIVCREPGGCTDGTTTWANNAVVFTWPADCEEQTAAANTGYVCYGFTQSMTTTGTDTSQPTYDTREQTLAIPLGGTAMTGQIVTPRNLSNGAYDIEWVDWARVVGIQNINPTETCASPQSDNGYGFSVRITFNGTPNNGPSIDSNAAGFIVRGFDFAHSFNANDPDDDTITYTAPTGNMNPYFFQPSSTAPGLNVNLANGSISMLAADTGNTLTFLDNHFDGSVCSADVECQDDTPNEIGLRCIGGHCMTGAAYLIKMRISDTRGATSESDMLLQPLATPNHRPTLDPIGDRTLYGGVPACFMVSASDVDGALPVSSDLFTMSPIPTGAALTPFAGGTSQTCPGSSLTLGCPSGKTCALFTWTPPFTSQSPFGVEFTVTDPGTSGSIWNNVDRLTATEVVRLRVSGNANAPVLKQIAGQTVGADPAKVQPVVGETKQFNALATSANAAAHLIYDLPALVCMSGPLCPVAGTVRPNTDITTDPIHLIEQGFDGFGRPVGVITLDHPSTEGTWLLTVRVIDTDNLLTDQKQVNITVGTFPNHSPQFRILPPTEIFTVEGVSVDFPVEAQELDVGQTVSVTMTGPAAATYGGAAGPKVKVGPICSTSAADCCVTAGCTPEPEISCGQLQANQPNTCNDSSTNQVCSPSTPCEKARFHWTPGAGDAGPSGTAYVIHFAATDSVAAPNTLTELAETVIHVAAPTGPLQILGVVPNHGPPNMLGDKAPTFNQSTVGNPCSDVSECNIGGVVPLGMACLATDTGSRCTDTAHLIHIYGQGFGVGTNVTLASGLAVKNLHRVSSVELTFNTDRHSFPATVNVNVISGTTVTLANGFQFNCPSELCANPDDTNYEGSNACAFVTGFPGCPTNDADGDGFSDLQETNHFIDADCDGLNTGMDIQLPGSTNSAKDIYVYYDWMDGMGATDFPWSTDPTHTTHEPFRTCTVGTDCDTLNPGIPLTACGFAGGGALPVGTVVPGAWDRVVQSFGTVTTKAGGTTTLLPSSTYTLQVASLAGFMQPSTFSPITLQVESTFAAVKTPKSVVCTGTQPAPPAFLNCKGGFGDSTTGDKVFIGSKTPINLHPIRGKKVAHYWVSTFGPQTELCTTGPNTSTGPHATRPWVDFFGMKTQNLPKVDGLAYHYALFGHYSNCDSCASCNTLGVSATCDGVTVTGTRPITGPDACLTSFGANPAFKATGIASVFGPDVIVSLGDNQFNCTEQWVRLEATTIMHELGHNLSLNHGGNDTTNYKPNYMSVMNYSYQVTGGMTTLGSTGSAALTYSGQDNGDLPETDLREEQAIPRSQPNTNPFTAWMLDQQTHVFGPVAGNSDYLDWNTDGTQNTAEHVNVCDPSTGAPAMCCDGDPNCDVNGGTANPPFVACVDSGGGVGVCQEQADINNDTAQNLLHDYNDWDAGSATPSLKLLYQCSAAFLPGAPNCSLTQNSALAAPLTSNCQITSEMSPQALAQQGFSTMPPVILTAEPQKACLDPQSHGVIPVYIDGQKGFDVHQIVLTSLRFVTAPVSNTSACSFQDNNHDGFTDLKCSFRQDQLNVPLGAHKLCISGSLTDTTKFSACFPIQLKNDPLNPCN